MLVKCPECDLQVSDKAISCPHCGYPLIQTVEPKPKRKRTKEHMRLPNGFGQITHLKDTNRRNPYRVMITVGTNELTGRKICKLLKPQAYFPTYNEAYEALIEYNRNPYDLDDAINVKELYERWTKEYFKTLKSASSERTITSAWFYCKNIYYMRAKDIRVRHIEGCMNEAPSVGVKSRIKSLFNLMLDYAVKYEIVDKNYARDFSIDKEDIKKKEAEKKDHISFTDEEMKILWDNEGVNIIDWILVQCYTGFRPQELGLIKLENINLDEMIIVGGMKTEAGTDRIVPIHSRIQNIIKRLYNTSVERGSAYLLSADDTPGIITYDKYRHRYDKIKKSYNLNPEHRAHDPRKTFVTMAKNAEVNEYAIKRIIGHKISDITEAIYTDRDVNWLREEIEKIP